MYNFADMEIVINSPKNFTEKQLVQLEKLILSGSQVKAVGLMDRILKAHEIAVYIDQDQVVASAILKNPALSYRNKVFKKAEVSNLASEYINEVGYIVTSENHRGRKLCQKLLAQLLEKNKSISIFATTRKPEMMHILEKFHFEKTGVTYDKDLSLFISRN
jgi:predicted GNAT family N-acyltransferase